MGDAQPRQVPEPRGLRRRRVRAGDHRLRRDHGRLFYGLSQGGRAIAAGLPFVMALKPRRGVWAYGEQARTPVDAARDLAWDGPDRPGDWTRVERPFRDGQAETWWAAEASLGWWGPDGMTRPVVATTDPATLPGKATWYLATGLPRPGGPRVVTSAPA